MDRIEKTIRFLIGAIIAAFFLYLAFRKTDWSPVGELISGADSIALALCLLSLAMAWRYNGDHWEYPRRSWAQLYLEKCGLVEV